MIHLIEHAGGAGDATKLAVLAALREDESVGMLEKKTVSAHRLGMTLGNLSMSGLLPKQEVMNIAVALDDLDACPFVRPSDEPLTA